MVGCWLINEGPGHLTLKDSSGNGFDGTFNGVTDSNWTLSDDGNAIDFPTTGSRTIEITDHKLLDPTYITIICKVKIAINPPENGNIFSKGANSGYRARLNTVRTVSWFDRGGINNITTTDTVTVGEWVTVAVVGGPSGLKIYFNGIEKATNSTVYGGPDTAQPLEFGQESDFTERFMGILDYVYMYDRAVSGDDIMKMYQAPYDIFELGSNPYIFGDLAAPPAGGIRSMRQLIGVGQGTRD